MTPFLCLISIALGVFLVFKAQKYEFNNRTSGGVVEHSSFMAMRFHGFKKALGFILMFGGVIVIAFQ